MSANDAEPPSPMGTSYPPADARRRALARFIDLAACLLPLALAPEGHPVAAGLASGALLLSSDALFGPGRSLGKRICGLRTINLLSRRPAGPLSSVQRNAVFALAVLPALLASSPLLLVAEVLGALVIVEAIFALLPLRRDLGQRRLGDLLAGTQVIDASIPLPLVEPSARERERLAVSAPTQRAFLPCSPLRTAPRTAPGPRRARPTRGVTTLQDIACASP